MKIFKILGKEVLSFGEPEGSKVHNTMDIATQSFRSGYQVEDISLEMMRRVAEMEPLVRKAIQKKNKDIIRNWFEIKPANQDEKVEQADLDIIYEFEKRTNFKHKMYVVGVSSDIYGTGFAERTFIEPKSKKSDDPVYKKAKPLNIVLLNSEFIPKRKYKESGNDKTLYYVYQEAGAEEKLIHPDRIIDYATDRFPHSYFGISKIHVLSHILKSKMNSDISSGEILNWFGHGILDMTIKNMNPEQQKKMLENFKTAPSFYAHDEFYQLEVKNPTHINPKPFYDYFYTNIAAALEMPKHILTGESLGNVTGSEIGISDYYNDVDNIQQLIVTPLIEMVYKQLLESHGRTWKYKIDWNPIFVDELSEAKILQSRSWSATQNKNAAIISVPEARGILNEGHINLDVDKIPKMPKIAPKDNAPPNIEPQPVIKKQKAIPLNAEQLRMIKEAGRREMEEQEKRLKRGNR